MANDEKKHRPASLTVTSAEAARAAKLAAAMNRAHIATGTGAGWDAESVLGVALHRGLTALTVQYLGSEDDGSEDDEEPHGRQELIAKAWGHAVPPAVTS